MIRKKKNLDSYKRAAKKYFSDCDAANASCNEKNPLVKPYTFAGLLCAMELSKDAFHDLAKTREGRRFVDYTLMKIEAFIEENALSGRLSASAAQNSLKYSLGWNDKEKTPAAEERAITVTVSDEAKELGE